ncbi:MAG TPA: hypothetical protein VG756_32585 [Pseudonocardiaceae bacterium]|jgi:hypothetical protein|nr:hypothetical protein [Pseudonocardiaceae bacterium]
MTARTKMSLMLLVSGAALLLAGIALGLVGAAQFRDFVQYGHHAGGSCAALPGHSGSSTTLVWLGVGCASAGVLAAIGALFTDRRPLLVIGASTVAAACLLAVRQNWSVIHAITVCAPYVDR